MKKSLCIQKVVVDLLYQIKKQKELEQKVKVLEEEILKLKNKNRSKVVRKQTLRRDNYECVICGDADNLHVDHIVPLSEGGQDILSNTQTLCLDCHIEKHKGEPAEKLLMSHK